MMIRMGRRRLFETFCFVGIGAIYKEEVGARSL
jgi:hypothetical protein